MYVCYVDEAGCTGVLPSINSPIQPLFVVAGIAVDQTRLRQVTFDFIDLKKEYFPNATIKNRGQERPGTYLQWVMAEVKGADLRRATCSPRRDARRHSFRFIDHVLGIIEKHQIRIFGKMFIKAINVPLLGVPIYTSSIQGIFAGFHHLLSVVNDEGIIVLDSRLDHMNVQVSYSIFTEKFKKAGDDHSRVSELPTFGHSENHVGLQLADFLCSALLFPLGVHAFCEGIIVDPTHIRPGYRELRDRFGSRLRQLQHRYPVSQDPFRMGGGIVVSDPLTRRNGSILFQPQRLKLPAPQNFNSAPPIDPTT